MVIPGLFCTPCHYRSQMMWNKDFDFDKILFHTQNRLKYHRFLYLWLLNNDFLCLAHINYGKMPPHTHFLEWQIFDSAKKLELKNVNFCGRSINFCKNCQMMIRQLNEMFTWHSVATAGSFFEQPQKIFSGVHSMLIFWLSKKIRTQKSLFLGP